VLFADGRPAGDPESFADGFARADGLHTSGDLRDRPIGLALGADGSLYVSDADYGRIWRIFYRR